MRVLPRLYRLAACLSAAWVATIRAANPAALPLSGLPRPQQESLCAGCVPVLLSDNTSAYFEEAIAPALYSVLVPEADIDRLPEIVGEAAGRLREYQEQAVGACEARTCGERVAEA